MPIKTGRERLLLQPATLSTLLLTLTLLVGSLPRAGAQQAPRSETRAGASTVVFAVQRYESRVTIDPIVILESGRLKAPPSDGGDDVGAEAAAADRFIKEYYRPGQKYRLLFGGGEAGTLEVVKYLEPGCVGMEASATVQTSIKLGGQVMALATNSNALSAKTNTRRAPTETERASALDLARRAFASKKVAAPRIKRMETNNLTAVDLNGDSQPELIGSFIIQGEWGVEEALFLIAEPAARGGFSASLEWFHRGQEADATYRRLVDILDLDGDGTAEVLVQGIYYESHDYMIYKKQSGAWRVVYQGAGGGC